MEKNPGTASATPTQVGEVLREVIKAVTTILGELDIRRLLRSFTDRGQILSRMLLQMFVAFMEEQTLMLVPRPVELPTWRTLKIGRHKSVDELVERLHEHLNMYRHVKVSPNPEAFAMIRSDEFSLYEAETEVELVKLWIGDISRGGISTHEIYCKAEELGLELCPPEVGPQLLLSWGQQIEGEFNVAMKAISVRNEEMNCEFEEMFCIRPFWHKGTYNPRAMNLEGHVHPGSGWSGDEYWIFMRRKK